MASHRTWRAWLHLPPHETAGRFSLVGHTATHICGCRREDILLRAVPGSSGASDESHKSGMGRPLSDGEPHHCSTPREKIWIKCAQFKIDLLKKISHDPLNRLLAEYNAGNIYLPCMPIECVDFNDKFCRKLVCENVAFLTEQRRLSGKSAKCARAVSPDV